MIQYFGTLCIFTNLNLGTLNRNQAKIIMLFYPRFRFPLMCDNQVKAVLVLNFAKLAYFHNPKTAKTSLILDINVKTLVLKLDGIISKLKKIKEDDRHLNQTVFIVRFGGGGTKKKSIWGVIILFCE